MDAVNIHATFELRSFTRSGDNTGTIWAVPGYSPAPLSPKFLKGFCSNGPHEYTCQIWKFVALHVPEIIGVLEKIGAVPGYAHAPYTLKFLKDVCLHGPSEYTCQI